MNTYKSVTEFFNTETPKDTEYFVDMNLAVSEQIMQYLKEKGWTQKRLAKELGKTESEISKWLSGMHNFTLKSIAKIAAVLDNEIIITPLEAKDKYMQIQYISLGIWANTNTSRPVYDYMEQLGIKFNKKQKELKQAA